MSDIDVNKLLRGYYEANLLPRDFSPERTVPDFAFNVLNPLGKLYRPLVDEQHLNLSGQRPYWPQGKTFAVCLTHDVDHVTARSVQQKVRVVLRTAKFLLRTGDESAAKRLILEGLATLRSAVPSGFDSYHCFERWLDLESSHDARSTFFFLPEQVGQPHYTDGAYRFSDMVRFDGHRCTVAEMMREIDSRGWEVGLHASWYAFDNLDELRQQKEQIERVLNHEIVSVRQHYLHYDIRTTPEIHSAAGFKYDSTLGFNDNVGFRFGTSYPWQLFDLQKKEILPILEVPLIVQDGALLSPTKGLRLDEESAFGYVVNMANAVEAVGGVLTLLWHPHQVVRAPWWNVYTRILSELKERNVWFASIRDVGEWWAENTVHHKVVT